MKTPLAFGTAAIAALSNIGQSLAQTPPGFSPGTNNTMSVKFGDLSIAPGAYVPLQQTQASPAVSFGGLPKNVPHIVLMVDLEARGGPSNSSLAPLLHWLVATPIGLSELANNQSTVPAPAFYFGPQPPIGSGKHRYVVLLLEGISPDAHLPPQYQEFDTVDISDRFVFNISGLAAEGGYQLVAANWYTTQTLAPVAAGAGPQLLQGGHVSILSTAALFVALALACF